MNLYVLSIIKLEQYVEEFTKLPGVSKAIVYDDVKSLHEVSELFEDEDEKILGIDPDLCDWKLDHKVLSKIKKLKAIFVPATSYEWIDLDYLKVNNIKLFNSPNFSSVAVAEWNLMVALNLVRKIPLLIKNDWSLNYERFQGLELRGKTCGVIGLGNIGSSYARLASGVGMKLNYWSLNTRNSEYKYVNLNRLFSSSDVIFLALKTNAQTQKLISDDLLTKMKNTAVFTTASSKIYNHELMLKLAASDKIGGYGFESSQNEFGKYRGNVWASTSHAWNTKESNNNNLQNWYKSINAYIQGKELFRVA